MSYSTLYAVYRTTATPLFEYRNAWGTGPVIWDYLQKRYLPSDSKNWIFGEPRLWDLATDPSVPLSLRACHAITFDFAMVPSDYLKQFAELLIEGGQILEGDTVNHFPEIGRNLRDLRLPKRAIGVGLNCTSVSDSWGEQRKHWSRDPWDAYSLITKDPK